MNQSDQPPMHLVGVINRNPLFRTFNLLYSTEPLEKQLSNESEILQFAQTQLQKDPTSLAIYLIEKQPMSVTEMENLLPSLTQKTVLGETDIYLRYIYECSFPNDLKVTIIKPCTLVHVKKYLDAPHKQVTETPEIYKTIVKPYINQIPPERTQWITDLINGNSNEPIYFNGDEFMICADSKWDQKDLSNLYLLVIMKDSTLKSIRDLNNNHIPLLESVKQETEKVLAQYNMGLDDVRLLFHYQPSYYHLHVHVICNQIRGLSGTVVGQCHLLDDILDNIRLKSDYYEEKTLRYFLNVLHPVYNLIQQ